LREPLIGRTVRGIWHDWPKTIRTPDPEQFAARIAGQTFHAVERRAKYILCQLDRDLLVVHLKMTGRLYVAADDEQHDADRWLHFRAQLDGGRQLRFSDARKFGFVALTTDLSQVAPDLGPEPLEDAFTPDVLAAGLRGHRKAIKALLLDQNIVAGIGNIYADEALHRAGIHPLTPAESLSSDQIERLHRTIRDALIAGIDAEGASVNWYRKPDGTTGKAQNAFLVYDRTGESCYTCGTLIEKIRVAQRGTHFCPVCQPRSSA
ncbi:MAG: bifunctional DNA-formamidopyrimidine glycosylase/DNA-(apurinic or apyrimidinic site) lyase, partial [Anaerolinea sp.]|nr:bifunctional DNA-formamidopyrimidine glycosylase/DNA-(apurinic or apyrimidinic site) lyase [Anaerolinea sp.]